jgi:adenylate cyclase
MPPLQSVLSDPKRLAALGTYQALDTPPEFEQDALTGIAAEICGCPVALISLMDEHRQWFKSNYGLPAMTECPPEVSVCSTTICSNDMVYVPDLTKDPRFKDFPTVIGEPHIRSYCGMPLINPEGFVLGTLCIIDFAPHELSPAQREAVRRLARQSMSLLELRRQLLARDTMVNQLNAAKHTAEEASRKSDQLLQSIFPAAIAQELQSSGSVKPRYYEMATIMFSDFKDFTLLTEGMEPARLIEQLNRNFANFDEIAAANRVVTVRTVGDGCLSAAGLPEKNGTHPLDACLAALQSQRSIAQSNRQRAQLRLKPWLQRIGINTGPVVAGVVGSKRYTYDVWGTAVNAAARLEQACEPGRINISSSTFHYVEALFETEPRGSIEVKNLGAIEMHFLNRIRPQFSADAEGCMPNEAFWQKAGLSEVEKLPSSP